MAESGVSNMRLRAEARGGHFELSSSVSDGTRLVWSVPVDEQTSTTTGEP